MTKVYLRVRHGAPRSNPEMKSLYASLYDAQTNELLVSSLLTYALDAVEERGYVLVEEPNPTE